MPTPYELLGEDGLKKLAYTFYEVMDELPEAAHIRHMHQASLSDVKQKLFEYLSGWMGGPDLYQAKYQSICLTKPHKAFAIDATARDQWLQCWHIALERVGASDELKQMLKDPMARMAQALVNQG